MKKPTAGLLLAVGLETLASCLAVSPLAGSAGSLNRSRNNSGRRHGLRRRAALRVGERQHATHKVTRNTGLSNRNSTHMFPGW
jgi:hypothetical protein